MKLVLEININDDDGIAATKGVGELLVRTGRFLMKESEDTPRISESITRRGIINLEGRSVGEWRIE